MSQRRTIRRNSPLDAVTKLPTLGAKAELSPSGVTRRELLKFGLALPLAMEALARRYPSFSLVDRATPPRRILFICNSLGFHAPFFFPKRPGDLTTSEYLKTLRMAEKVTVFSNLYHPGMETSNHDSEKSFLTGTPNPEAANFVNTVSVDQLLVQKLGTQTRFSDLSLSIYDRGWGCSWSDRGVAIPPLHDTDQIFELLFGSQDMPAKKRQLTDDLRILAALQTDLESLQAQEADREKLANHQRVIRELQLQLERESYWLSTEKPAVEKTLSDNKEYEFSTKIHNLFELIKLAFRTDSTRVIALSLDWIYGAIKVPGAMGGWHTLSHHGGNPELLSSLSCVERDILKHFDQFLWDLNQIPAGTGSLLDYTTVVLGSNFGNSSDHTCQNLPILIAGGGHRHQGHHVCNQQTHLCNLYLELLHLHDIDVGQFGSSQRNMRLLS